MTRTPQKSVGGYWRNLPPVSQQPAPRRPHLLPKQATLTYGGLLVLLPLLAACDRDGAGRADPEFAPPSFALVAADRRASAAELQETRAAGDGDAVLRLTDRDTEDDYPALVTAADGTSWLAFVEYAPGRPIDMEAVLAGRFDSLITNEHGDRIRLMRFDGENWHPPLEVTPSRLDVWRPTVSVDGGGNVIVAWAQSVRGDWEIFYRQYAPHGDQRTWSDIVRVSNLPGADFHVVSATDSEGSVWLAWQGWREDNFDIQLAKIGEAGKIELVKQVPNTQANDWSPAIAADQQGNVFVVWDCYDQDNYDVRLQVIGDRPQTVTVAGSARFEARPHVVCDAAGRLWIAYEEGDEQWGKDYSTPVEWERHRGEVDPGFGLYVQRTIRVKCWHRGQLLQPAAGLGEVLGDSLPGNKSLPRMAVDASGGLWLLFRRHLQPGSRGGGEAWHSFAVRYDGRGWSAPKRLLNSSNLLDNRPALAPRNSGVLAVHSSDTRTRTARREQNDLFATMLRPTSPGEVPQLVPAEPIPAATVPIVHADEDTDVARMRGFRLQVGGKSLRLLRGDFHRHTEYSAHRDGDGLLEDSWRYALDAGRLDWLGNGDHDNGYGHEYHWWQIQKVTDLFHNPPGFVAVQSYERSNTYPNGHRNVIFPRRGIRPLPRGELSGSAAAGTPDTKLLYAYLKHFGGMCAAHTSGTGMGTDWRDNDPEVEPVVEIFQGCRQVYQSYEHLGAPRAAPRLSSAGKHDAGYVWNALAKGYRLGFQASSDHFSTHISYAVVLAPDSSRQAIIEAFKRRHCYAANDNILLIVRSGPYLMGDVFQTAQRPKLQISVQAPQAISQLHVIRDNRYVYTTQPNLRRFDRSYTDTDAKPGQTYYYYVRVEQQDGSLAWASPMWITYKP